MRGDGGYTTFYIKSLKYITEKRMKVTHIEKIKAVNKLDKHGGFDNHKSIIVIVELSKDQSTHDRKVRGKYFKNFNKECKLMVNLDGRGYVQKPVIIYIPIIPTDTYLDAITPSTNSTITLSTSNTSLANSTPPSPTNNTTSTKLPWGDHDLTIIL